MTHPIAGLRVELRTCNRATLVAGRAPHRYGLMCAACGRWRGWLDRKAGKFLEKLIARVGKPPTPPTIRTKQTSPAVRPLARGKTIAGAD